MNEAPFQTRPAVSPLVDICGNFIMSEHLKGQLADLQQSLAAALASIEVHRLRHQKLHKENVQLRHLLRAHGINPGDAESLEGGNEDVRSSSLPHSKEEDKPTTTARADAQERADADVHVEEVVLHANGLQIPGHVSIKPEAFEFGAVAATISPQQFVGVRYFASQEEAKSAYVPSSSDDSKATWWENLFGPSEKRGSAQAERPVGSPPSQRALGGLWQSRPRGAGKSPTDDSDPDGYISIPHPSPPKSSSMKSLIEEGSHITTTLAAGLQDGLKRVIDFGALRSDPAPAQPSSSLSRRSWNGVVPGDRPGGSQITQSEYAASFRAAEGATAGAVLARPPAAGTSDHDEGIWQIIWKDEASNLRTLTFQTSMRTRNLMQCLVERWNSDAKRESSTADSTSAATSSPQAVTDLDGYLLCKPEHLVASKEYSPAGAKASRIISGQMASALAGGLPGRRKVSDWSLLYSTERDGFLLQSMYRAGANANNTVMVVEAFDGYVFGAYCTDPWRVNPRYQGKGECFVFQLRPHMVKYGWHHLPPGHARNDFFMLVGHDSVGIGGGGSFAIWLDSDLLWGKSGHCMTFGCPVLSGAEEFKIKALELWQIGK